MAVSGLFSSWRDSGNQLPDRCQLLTVEQLLLSTAQVFISLARFPHRDSKRSMALENLGCPPRWSKFDVRRRKNSPRRAACR